MKQWMLGLAIAGVVVVGSGCTSDAQTPSSGDRSVPPEQTQQTDAQAKGVAVADEKAPTSGLEEISISDTKVAQIDGDTKRERLWEVVATIRNGSASPLPGLELVADLRAEGASHPFARNSAELRFEAPLAPGKTFTWRSLSPVDGEVDAESVSVDVKATRWLEAAKAEDDGWKPLDPSTATPKTVGETITILAGTAAKSDSAR